MRILRFYPLLTPLYELSPPEFWSADRQSSKAGNGCQLPKTILSPAYYDIQKLPWYHRSHWCSSNRHTFPTGGECWAEDVVNQSKKAQVAARTAVSFWELAAHGAACGIFYYREWSFCFGDLFKSFNKLSKLVCGWLIFPCLISW